MADLNELLSSQPVKIAGTDSGGTEQEWLGSTGRRLWTQSRRLPAPDANALTLGVQLLNAGSKEMNVAGTAGAPVNFSVAPPVGQTWWINDLRLYIVDGGTFGPTNFGSLTALTNGLRMQAIVGGVTYDLMTIMDNMDLVTLADKYQSVGIDKGALDNSDTLVCHFEMHSPLRLIGPSDSIRWQVRDNLTGIDNMRSSANYFREL